MRRNCTQHKDFNEHVYQRLYDKYKDFRLPHTWSNAHIRFKRANPTHMLRSGLETPRIHTPQSNRLFSPKWGKQKLIKALSLNRSSLQSSPALSSPSNAMLSTQFNSGVTESKRKSIPLFSNSELTNNTENILSGKTFLKGEFCRNLSNFSQQLNPLKMDYCDHHDIHSNASEEKVLNATPEIRERTPFSKSLSDALSRTLGACENEFDHNCSHSELISDDSQIKALSAIKSNIPSGSEFQKEPFINFHDMDAKKRSAVKSRLLACEEVVIALLYSDNTSHFGIGTSKLTYEKITVSGICFVCKIKECNDNFGVLIPVSSSGNNEKFIVEFLQEILISDALKISFNCYQLYIVCNILIKPLMQNEVIKNIIDLKIASWLLTSDEVPQNLSEIEQRYVKDTTSTPNSSSSFLHRLYLSMINLLNVKQRVYSCLAEEKLLNLFRYLECPLLDTICQMGQTGICIDKTKLQSLSTYLAKRLSVVEREAASILGRPVLLSSPVQLRHILYDELRLDEKVPNKMSRTAATKEKSTSEDCLLKLVDLHPLPQIILDHRKLSKIKSTYVDGLNQYMRFGKLYPSWDQTSASTGRLAAFNPNVQSFPKDSIDNESAHSVREIIIPSSGFQFVAVDFCSIELRILAHFAKDQELLDMFNGQGDIFITLTASWKNIPLESVTSIDRNKTKRVCYAIIYGVGIPKLSQILQISMSEAKSLMNSFLAKFQNISKFTNAVIRRAKDTKKLRTILNRLRHFPDINQSNFALRKSIERQAVNFVIQGSAADICKVSMLKLSEHLRANQHINARLLIQIHDELLYEVYHENVNSFARAIYHILESPEFTSEIHLSVPLKVKVEVGDSWGSMHEFEGDAKFRNSSNKQIFVNNLVDRRS